MFQAHEIHNHFIQFGVTRIRQMYTIYIYQFNDQFIDKHRVVGFCKRVECIPVTVAVFDLFVAVNLASVLQNAIYYMSIICFFLVSFSIFSRSNNEKSPFQTVRQIDCHPNKAFIILQGMSICIRYNLKWAIFESKACCFLFHSLLSKLSLRWTK